MSQTALFKEKALTVEEQDELCRQSRIDPADCLGCSEAIAQGRSNPYCKVHKKCVEPECGGYFLRRGGFKPKNNYCKEHNSQYKGLPAADVDLDCAECLATRNSKHVQPRCVLCDRARGKRRAKKKTSRKKRVKKKTSRKKRVKKKKASKLGKGRPTKKKRPEWAERLKAARLSKGLSQVELAEKVGVTKNVARAVSLWELGEKKPTAGQQQRLSEIVGWDGLPGAVEREEKQERPSATTPLAAWLTKHRLLAGLTDEELATKSKVSSVLIHAVEQGLPGALQERDVRALERALGTKVPKDVLPGRNLPKKLLTYTLVHFERDAPPSKRGVYLVLQRHKPELNRPIYVGKGVKGQGTIRDRIKKHKDKAWFVVDAGLCAYIEIEDPDEAYRIEQLLIALLNPPWNVQGRTDL